MEKMHCYHSNRFPGSNIYVCVCVCGGGRGRDCLGRDLGEGWGMMLVA